MNSIEIKNVSKKFRIYHDKTLTLKERALFFNRTRFEEHQVLDNISLNIEKGKTFGLIGQNGSGKSTLLKLLTKIIYPDKGEIITNGRVSSLLELGAGFHPDFSGRENIYTNSAIFGLTRKEIDKRLKDIVDFSELGEFIDNPVRTYSSGMYMRLAFSVAINVDADILLIDEILAVGDANFQKKCMDNINELKKKGVTIVLVTHDMGTVERLCDGAIWLENGRIMKTGNSKDTINDYLEFMWKEQNALTPAPSLPSSPSPFSRDQEKRNKIRRGEEYVGADSISAQEAVKRWGNKDVVITNVELFDEKGAKKTAFRTGEKAIIRINYERYNTSITNPVFGIGVVRNDGVNCYGTNTQIDRIGNVIIKDKGFLDYEIEKLNLLEGKYLIDAAVHDASGFPYDYVKEIKEFDVYSNVRDVGIMRLEHKWSLDGEYVE